MRRLALLALAFVSVTTLALADRSPTPTLGALVAPGDTFKIAAAWAPVTDAQGPADTYLVTWQTTVYHYPVNGSPVTQPVRTISTTADTLVTPMPPYSDSLLVKVTVQARRNGYLSATSTSAQKFFRRPNPVPPAVGPITLDTAATS